MSEILLLFAWFLFMGTIVVVVELILIAKSFEENDDRYDDR